MYTDSESEIERVEKLKSNNSSSQEVKSDAENSDGEGSQFLSSTLMSKNENVSGIRENGEIQNMLNLQLTH